MTLFVASVLLAVAASVYVILPLVQRRLAMLGDPIPGGVLDAEARKRVALASLREVEYDRIGGKLDDDDYLRLKAQLEREALDAMEAAAAAHAGADADAAAASAGGAAGDFVVTHSCGFGNPPGSRFCSGCGATLGGGRGPA
jgi:hypothetical protein